jgi:hypothetical protein
MVGDEPVLAAIVILNLFQDDGAVSRAVPKRKFTYTAAI